MDITAEILGKNRQMKPGQNCASSRESQSPHVEMLYFSSETHNKFASHRSNVDGNFYGAYEDTSFIWR